MMGDFRCKALEDVNCDRFASWDLAWPEARKRDEVWRRFPYSEHGVCVFVKPLGLETLLTMKGVRTRATLEHHMAC